MQKGKPVNVSELTVGAARLVCTSVDDVRSSLPHHGPECLPVLREALAYCETHKGHATRRVLLRRRIQQLEAGQPQPTRA